jgi:hypothetical protein
MNFCILIFQAVTSVPKMLFITLSNSVPKHKKFRVVIKSTPHCRHNLKHKVQEILGHHLHCLKEQLRKL